MGYLPTEETMMLADTTPKIALGRITKKEKPMRFVLRLPKSLHAELQEVAAREGTSLNTMVVILIGSGLLRRNYELEQSESQVELAAAWKNLSKRRR